MRIEADTTKVADRGLGDSEALDSRLTRVLDR